MCDLEQFTAIYDKDIDCNPNFKSDFKSGDKFVYDVAYDKKSRELMKFDLIHIYRGDEELPLPSKDFKAVIKSLEIIKNEEQ